MDVGLEVFGISQYASRDLSMRLARFCGACGIPLPTCAPIYIAQLHIEDFEMSSESQKDVYLSPLDPRGPRLSRPWTRRQLKQPQRLCEKRKKVALSIRSISQLYDESK